MKLGIIFVSCSMKDFRLLLAFLVFPVLGKAQSSRQEFEGRVYFTSHYNIKSPDIDPDQVAKALGSSSVYTYKAGRYKWISFGGDFQYEFYDGIEGLLVDKYGADTLYRLHIENRDTLVSYKIQHQAATICGYSCDAIHMVIISEEHKQRYKRTIYYAPQLYIDPAYFKLYRHYANDKMYALAKGLPLRIVMEFGWLPVEITMDATKVELEPIAESELQLDRRLYIK